MSSKHTPGPWNLIESNAGCKNIYQTGDDENGGIFAVQEIGYTHGRANESEDAANARLICAAPDLLAACEATLATLIEWGDGEGETADELRAVIAKAKGLTPPRPIS